MLMTAVLNNPTVSKANRPIISRVRSAVPRPGSLTSVRLAAVGAAVAVLVEAVLEAKLTLGLGYRKHSCVFNYVAGPHGNHSTIRSPDLHDHHRHRYR